MTVVKDMKIEQLKRFLLNNYTSVATSHIFSMTASDHYVSVSLDTVYLIWGWHYIIC